VISRNAMKIKNPARQPPVGSPAVRSQEDDQTDDQHDAHYRADGQQHARHQGQAWSGRRRTTARNVGCHLKHREAMHRLPHQIRRRQQQRDRDSGPQSRTQQAAPRTADHHTEQTTHQQRRSQDLDLHRHPGQHTGGDPRRPPLRLASHRSDQQPHHRGRRHHVERCRLEQMPDSQGQGRHGNRRSSRHLMPGRRAELPGYQAAQQHIPTRRQRRQNPKSPQMAAHQPVPARRQIRHQHRII
jgi:hypothetical protein